MFIAFLDDTNRVKDGWHARGGFILKECYLIDMENDFIDILIKHGVPIDNPGVNTEIKWSLSTKSWIRNNIKGNKRVELYNELLSLIDKYEAALIIAAFHYKRLERWTINKAKQESYIYLLERIQSFAAFNNETALVICDNEDDKRKTRERIREIFILVSKGSPYIPLKNIYRHIWAVDSEYHAGIQLADLIVGITLCLLVGKVRWALKCWSNLKGRFMYIEEIPKPRRYGMSILPSYYYPKILRKFDPYGATY